MAADPLDVVVVLADKDVALEAAEDVEAREALVVGATVEVGAVEEVGAGAEPEASP